MLIANTLKRLKSKSSTEEIHLDICQLYIAFSDSNLQQLSWEVEMEFPVIQDYGNSLKLNLTNWGSI